MSRCRDCYYTHPPDQISNPHYCIARMTEDFEKAEGRIAELEAQLAAARASIARLEPELRLRRAQMNAFPFCPDHRDKVHGKSCRECRVEELQASIARKQVLLKRLEYVAVVPGWRICPVCSGRERHVSDCALAAELKE